MSSVGRILQSPKNQPAVPKSSVKRGADSLTLTSEDMNDRIINLRFFHKPAGPGKQPGTFTLRSDYEVQYTANGFQYVNCAQKPAIKISYKQVANSTNIELNIVVTNLFIKDMRAMSSKGSTIHRVEIQIGYRSQMPDWARDPYWSKRPVSEFYALRDNNVTVSNLDKIPPGRIVADVLTTQRISVPPDMGTQFQCVVGNIDQGLRWVFDEDSLKKSIDSQSSGTWNGKQPQNRLPIMFFELVTRRFLKTNIRHDISNTEKKSTDSAGKVITTVDQSVVIYNDGYVPTTTLSLQDGRMSASDADKYGIVVSLSKRLWELPVEEVPMWGMTDKEVSQVVPIMQPVFTELYERLPAQLKAIVKQYPFIRYYMLSDGNYYAYHVDESEDELFTSEFIYNEQKKGIYKLPAVYDISWNGTRQIRTPFFSAIAPGITVAFQSSYTLNDLIGNFYQPEPTNNCYLVVLLDVKFSTVGTDNTMEMTCVDVKGKYEPVTAPDGSIKPVAVPAIPNKSVRDKIWKEVELEVVYSYKGEPDTVDSSWSSIVQLLLASTTQFSARWGTLPTATDAIDALKAWNTALFGPSRTGYAVSSESGMYGTSLPVLFGKEHNPINPGVGDKVRVKLPFLPAPYNPSEQIV